MCTLIALHRCFPEAPLVIAANRDEYLDRPAEGPSLRRAGERAILAPRDLRAGGTWWGLNDRGLFAALTNRPTRALDASRRSRGLLVTDALADGSAARAAERLARLPARAYNPFNLFLCDDEDALVVVYEDKPSLMALSPGPHVIGNADPDTRRVPKVARLLGEVERVAAGRSHDALEALAGVCRVHGAGATPLEDTCIHAGGYGTRSSTLLQRGECGEADRLRFADGPPCQTGYRDFTLLLRALDPNRLAGGDEQRTVA